MYTDYTYRMLAAERVAGFMKEAANDRLVRIARAGQPTWSSQFRHWAGRAVHSHSQHGVPARERVAH